MLYAWNSSKKTPNWTIDSGRNTMICLIVCFRTAHRFWLITLIFSLIRIRSISYPCLQLYMSFFSDTSTCNSNIILLELIIMQTSMNKVILQKKDEGYLSIELVIFEVTLSASSTVVAQCSSVTLFWKTWLKWNLNMFIQINCKAFSKTWKS